MSQVWLTGPSHNHDGFRCWTVIKGQAGSLPTRTFLTGRQRDPGHTNQSWKYIICLLAQNEYLWKCVARSLTSTNNTAFLVSAFLAAGVFALNPKTENPEAITLFETGPSGSQNKAKYKAIIPNLEGPRLGIQAGRALPAPPRELKKLGGP